MYFFLTKHNFFTKGTFAQNILFYTKGTFSAKCTLLTKATFAAKGTFSQKVLFSQIIILYTAHDKKHF